MTLFLIQLAESDRLLLRDKVDMMVVSAADSTNALAAAKAKFTGTPRAAWAAATVTTLADVAANAGASLVGWRFRVLIPDAVPVIDVSVVGTSTDDTIDEIAALLVTALNATAIDNASYNASTQVLTVASIADGIGNKTLTVEVRAPIVSNNGGQTSGDDLIPGFVGAIVHQGIAGAVLTVTLPADTYVVPRVLAVGTAR